MENDIFIFQLSKELEYSKSGDFHKTATIEFTPPSMAAFDESVTLGQLVTNAVLDARRFAEESTQEQIEQTTPGANEIKIILMASKSVKFTEIANAFKALALKTGTTDGETALTESLLKKISIHDMVGMVCGYVANFTFPSLF
jgi:hypothetical protein